MSSAREVAPRYLRRRSGLTQEELAAKAGVSVKTVQRLERRQSISLRSRRAIATALGVPLDELTAHPPGQKKPAVEGFVTCIRDATALFAALDRCPPTSIWVDEGLLPAKPSAPWWNPKVVLYLGDPEKLINTVVGAIETGAASFADRARQRRPVNKALAQLAALGWELRVVEHDSPPSSMFYLGISGTLIRKIQSLRKEFKAPENASGVRLSERADGRSGISLTRWLFTAALVFLLARTATLVYGEWRADPFATAVEAAAITGNWPSEQVYLKQGSVTVLPFFFLTDAQVTVATTGGQQLAAIKIIHNPFVDFWVVRSFSAGG